MNKFLILTLSLVVIAGCSGGEIVVEDLDNTDLDVVVSECSLGEVYSLDSLSFEICSVEEVTTGVSAGNLTPVDFAGVTQGFLVSGDYENNLLKVNYEELKSSLETGMFTGIESSNEEGFAANYVDVAGFNVLEIEHLGANQGYKDFFVLVNDDVLTFDDNFRAITVLSGVVSR